MLLRAGVLGRRGCPPNSDQRKTLCVALEQLPLRHLPSTHIQRASYWQELRRASINPWRFLTKRQPHSPGLLIPRWSYSQGLSKGQPKPVAPHSPWGDCLRCPQPSFSGSCQQHRKISISAWFLAWLLPVLPVGTPVLKDNSLASPVLGIVTMDFWLATSGTEEGAEVGSLACGGHSSMATGCLSSAASVLASRSQLLHGCSTDCPSPSSATLFSYFQLFL